MSNKTYFEKVSFKQWVWDAYRENVDEVSLEKLEQYKKDYNAIKLPKRATSRSAGYDIFSTFDFGIGQQQDVKIPLGWKVYLKDDEFLMVVPRSGLGFKYYTRLANSTGIIDGDYVDNPDNEGHCWIKLRNEGFIHLQVKEGDAIAQAIIVPFRLVDGDTLEGEKRVGGFGSTSKK